MDSLACTNKDSGSFLGCHSLEQGKSIEVVQNALLLACSRDKNQFLYDIKIQWILYCFLSCRKDKHTHTNLAQLKGFTCCPFFL